MTPELVPIPLIPRRKLGADLNPRELMF